MSISNQLQRKLELCILKPRSTFQYVLGSAYSQTGKGQKEVRHTRIAWSDLSEIIGVIELGKVGSIR